MIRATSMSFHNGNIRTFYDEWPCLLVNCAGNTKVTCRLTQVKTVLEWTRVPEWLRVWCLFLDIFVSILSNEHIEISSRLFLKNWKDLFSSMFLVMCYFVKHNIQLWLIKFWNSLLKLLDILMIFMGRFICPATKY